MFKNAPHFLSLHARSRLRAFCRKKPVGFFRQSNLRRLVLHPGGGEHVLYAHTVAARRVVDEHMRHRAHEAAPLNPGRRRG